MTGDHWSSGFGARLLLAWPPRKAKVWTEAVINSDTAAAYTTLLEAMLGLQFRQHNGDDVPHHLTLSPQARTAWIGFYNAWGNKQANAEGNAAAAFSKLEGYAARLALVHHVAEKLFCGEDDLTQVQPESIQAGVELVKWFAAEAERIYSLLSESEEQGSARRLAEMIRCRGGNITVRDLQRSNPAKYETSDAAEAALNILVAADFGSWRVDEVGPKGGRPLTRFVLHPTPDKTDTTSPDSEADFHEGADTTSQTENADPVFSTNNEVVSVVSTVGQESKGEINPLPEKVGGEVVSTAGEVLSTADTGRKSRRKVVQ